MTFIIVGQAPSRNMPDERPFSGRSGAKLVELMQLPSHESLYELFTVRNLIDRWPGANGKGDAFPRAEMRAAAGRERERWVRGDAVLLVGIGVGQLFYRGVAPLTWYLLDGVRTAVVPHPSGVNHWWNDKQQAARARVFFGTFGCEAQLKAGWTS